MSAIYTDGDFTVAEITGARRWSDPLNRGEATTFDEDYIQALTSWRALPLDTLHPDPTPFDYAVLVGESPLQDLGGGIVKWTRTYSLIPLSYVRHEAFAYTFPGLATDALYPVRAISAVTYGTGTTLITTTVSHGISTNDLLFVNYTAQMASGDQIGRTVLRKATSASGSSITVPIIVDPLTIVQWNRVQKTDLARDPITRTVNSRVQYDYFLAGWSPGVATEADIAIIQPAFVVDENGKQTNTYAATSAPTKTEYLADVKAGNWIVAEASTTSYWKGNIIERRTRYVKAE